MLIPRPKRYVEKPGVMRLQKGAPVKMEIAAGSKAEQPTVRVIRTELKRLLGNYGGATVSVKWQALSRPGSAANASRYVDAPSVPEQAFALTVEPKRIRILANTAIGALYALSTLRQLKQAPGVFSLCDITDWPDTEIRIARRPLLCAEARGAALDWGDGITGFIKRWKEEIDFALRFRYNGFFAWGFSGFTEPFPEFQHAFKVINAYARARGVKLCFGGLGISKNETGTVRILADADRHSVGLGAAVKQTWPCSRVDPRQKPDVYCGTCRSSAAIRAQKIKDLAAFVQAVEPSLLYIHHEDLNTIEETQQQFWDCRCDNCRRKWPDDRVEALHGGAGAIADTMNAYSEALASVPVSSTGYNAMRDCVILYTSPGYGDWSESAEQWGRVQTLWCNVVRQLNHPEHFAISVREQFRDDGNASLRIEELSRRIHEIAPACGLHVFVAGGADMYYNNAPFCHTGEIFSSCAGARVVFTFNGILFQRPLQMFNAETLWNMEPGEGRLVKTMPATRDECRQALRDCIQGPLPPAYHEPDGWLAKACRFLYGAKAGEVIFRYQLLRSPSGCFPLCILYHEMRMRRKLFRIMDNPETDYQAEVIHWRETQEVTEDGLRLVREALAASAALPAPLRRELEHQAGGLEMGILLSKAALAFFSRKVQDYKKAVAAFARAAATLPGDFIAPEEGDSSLYAEYIEWLKARTPAGK